MIFPELELVVQNVDNLDYDYLGNQLVRAEDSTSNTQGFKDVSSAVGTQEYSYDQNGNMVKDANKGITAITYNYLNLPQQVTLNTGTTIHYTYDAAGIKHQKVVDDGSPETTTYIGGFHYTNNTLQFLQHAEGRALKSGTSWTYEYNLTDHLGNVRVSVDESGSVVQRDGYYPFGGAFNSWHVSPKNNYLYNGKELQNETEWYDYGARMFDPWLGRWNRIDSYAEGYQLLSPYSGLANNPVIFKDVDGNRITLHGSKQSQREFVQFLQKYIGLDLTLSKDGQLGLTSKESNGQGSEYLRNLTIALLDPEGTDYDNDVDFYLITGEKKLKGHKTSDKIFLDDFDAGTFDLDDLRAFDQASFAFGAANLAHVLEERRSTGDYRGLLERTKQARKEAKNPNLLTPESYNKYENGHLLANIFEGKVAVELLKPGEDPENADAATFTIRERKKTNTITISYGDISFSVITDKKGKVLRVDQ